MKALGLLFSGFLFGIGLLVSGMTQPAKVLGFLDVAGAWDPSLGLVMVGAIGVHALSYRIIRRRRAPLWEPAFEPTRNTGLDGRLVVGAILFGLGWGLGGYCPGPALVSLVALDPSTLAFCAAFALGVLAFSAFERRRTHPSAAATPVDS